jgi:hypothetical protein
MEEVPRIKLTQQQQDKTGKVPRMKLTQQQQQQ